MKEWPEKLLLEGQISPTLLNLKKKKKYEYLKVTDLEEENLAWYSETETPIKQQ